jgi:hypothetical protein
MARVINLEDPLSDEDRKYLVDRCRWAQLAQADGLNSPKEAQRRAAARLTPDGSLAAPTVVLGGTPEVPQEPSGDPLADKPYEEWPHAALQEELKARQQEAMDAGMPEAEAKEKYKAGGKSAELVQRLKDDDATAPPL